MRTHARWTWLTVGCLTVALAGCSNPKPSGPCPDGSEYQVWYPDVDGDGFGDEASKLNSCEAVEHYILEGGDCDDSDPLINPAGHEVCDPYNQDEDCDGLVGNDDAIGAQGAVTGWPDADGDGYGDPDGAQQPACVFGEGTVDNDRDCDDTDPKTHPGAAEFDDPLACLQDKDGDGFGERNPTNGAEPGTDCRDNDDRAYPGAPEILIDGGDQDCDGYDAFGLFDDFEIGLPNPAVWSSVNGNYRVSTDYPANGYFGLTLSGDQALLETRNVDTTFCSSLSWWFEGKRGPDMPSSTHYVYVQFWDGSRWVTIDTWEGGTTDGTHLRRGGPITDYTARNPDFKLRLNRSGGSVGFDDFHIDDFFVGCPGPDVDGDGVPTNFDCDEGDPAHWYDCGVCVDGDGDDYGVDCDLGDDCDDGNRMVFPGAQDPRGDGIDGNCDGYDGVLFFDDFEDGVPDPWVWDSLSGDFEVQTLYVADGTYALNLGGGGAVATTGVIDTSQCTNVFWRFLGKRGPEMPDTGDDVLIEYWNGSGWQQASVWAGGGQDSAFSEIRGELSGPSAIHRGFQIQLTSDGSGIGLDDFFIDDFMVGCADDADGDGFYEQLDCDDNDPLHWSDCGLCVDGDGDGYGTACDLGADCDDGNAGVNPGIPDPRGDGLDTNCDGYDGVLFADDFESGTWDPWVWAVVSGDYSVQTTIVDNGAYALNLGGGGATAETLAMDTSACTGVFYAFRGKRGPEMPDNGDDVDIEYWNGSTWQLTEMWAGGGEDPDFLDHWGTLSGAGAQHPSFKLRFTSNGSGTGLDDFFIDDFTMGCADETDGDGVFDPLDCAPNDPLHWSDCGNCTDGDGDGHGVGCDLAYDCDDADPAISPAAAEVDGNGVDENCDGYDRPALADGFELGNPRPEVWASVTGGVEIQGDEVYAGSLAVQIDAADGRMESRILDTSSCADVWYTMRVKRVGNPVTNDDLVFSYDTSAGWVEEARVAGSGFTDGDFLRIRGTLGDAAALWSGFRVELDVSGLGPGTGGFVVDDFAVTCGEDVDGDGSPAFDDCDDSDPAHWSDCGLCVDADGDDFGASCDLGEDCDDGDAGTYPGAPDPVGDLLDTNCDGEDGVVLFDDFELGVFDPAVFANVGGDAAVQSTYRHNGTWALDIGGGGSVETVTIDVSSCIGVAWSYMGKRGPDQPEATDALTVEWWDGVNWVQDDRWFGASVVDATFKLRWGVITDPAAFHNAFAIRLSNNGTANSDDFYIDDIQVSCTDLTDTDADGVIDTFDCDDVDPWHWSDCGNCTDADVDGYGAGCDLGDDCNDADPVVNPGGIDLGINGLDEDCDALDGAPLAFDDFELGTADPAVWASVTGDQSMESSIVFGGSWSQNIGGGGATMIAQPVDTTMCTSVGYRFWAQQGPEQPDLGDDLDVSYDVGLGMVAWETWVAGDSSRIFKFYSGNITDPAAISPNFTLQLYTFGSGAGFDDWFLDDVAIGCAP